MNVFVCEAPVHILRAIQMKLRMKEFAEDADVYIGTSFWGYAGIIERLRTIGLFRKVICSASNHYKGKALALLYGHNEFAKELRDVKYKKLIAFNIDGTTAQALYHINRGNPGFEYHCVEDGPALYKVYAAKKYKIYHPYRLLGIEQQCFHMTSWWCSCPQYTEVPYEYTTEIKELPLFDFNDDELVNIVNAVFDYKQDELLSQTDVLIMEESHFTDGVLPNSEDFLFYKKVKDRYPDLKFMVKLHPRTKINRFANVFPIMMNSASPWELYVVNQIRNGRRKCIQMSITCGTMFSDKFMFGEEGCKIILASLFYKVMLPTPNGFRITPYEIKRFEDIRSIYKQPENFIVAKSEEQVFGELDRMIRVMGKA